MANRIKFDIPINTALLHRIKGTSLESKYKPVGEFYNNEGQVGSTDYYAISNEIKASSYPGSVSQSEAAYKFNTYRGGRATLHLYPEKLFGPEGNGYNIQRFAPYKYNDAPYDPKTLKMYIHTVPYSALSYFHDSSEVSEILLRSNWYNWGDQWGESEIALIPHEYKLNGLASSWDAFESCMLTPDSGDTDVPLHPPVYYDTSEEKLYIDKYSAFNRYDGIINGTPESGYLGGYHYINRNSTDLLVSDIYGHSLQFDTTYYPAYPADVINNKANFTLSCKQGESFAHQNAEAGFAPKITTSFIVRKRKHKTPVITYNKAKNRIEIIANDGSEFNTYDENSYTIKIDGYYLSHYPGVKFTAYESYAYITNLPKSLIYGKHQVDVIRDSDKYLTIDGDNSHLVIFTDSIDIPSPGNYATCEIIESFSSWNVYTQSDTGTLTYENKAETPTDLKIEQLDVDKIKLTWKYTDTTAIFAVKQELNYDHIIHPVQTSTQETSMIIDNLPLGNHRFSVAAAYPEAPEGLSNFVVKTYSSTRLMAPYSISFTRKTVNSGSVVWKTQTVQDKFTSLEYGVKINGTLDGEYIKDKSKIIYNLPQGRNKISVFTHYPKNPDYDSIEYDTYPELSKISKPTIKLTENYSDVTYTDPDTGETVTVIGEDGKPKQGVSSVSVSWATDDASKYKGIEYILYDRFKEEVIAQPRTSDTKIELTTQATFKGVGKHNLYVKAIFVDDEGYNSDNSSEVSYEINTLAKPKLVWSNDLPDWNGKKIEESRLTWMPVTTGSSNNNHADYYLVKAIADNQQRGNSITLLQPADLNKRVSTFIPDPDPYTGAIKGLIAEDPAITTEYKINVYAMSFNEFYVGGSEPATADYKIIRLSAPQNIIWTPDNLTLSWEAVAEANTYYLYDDNIKIDETNSTSYKFAHIEDKLHVFNITANKITTEEA